MLGDGVRGGHVGFAVGGELCGVVAGDAGVVDEELDAFGFLFRELFVEAGYIVLVARDGVSGVGADGSGSSRT
jgi:hypothetical protein